MTTSTASHPITATGFLGLLKKTTAATTSRRCSHSKQASETLSKFNNEATAKTIAIGSSCSTSCCSSSSCSDPIEPRGSSLKISTQKESLKTRYGCTTSISRSTRKDQSNGLLRQEQDPHVSFSTVAIHSHPIILGDNPAVSQGLPITIDWNATHSETCHVDDFEEEQHQLRGDGGQDDLRIPKTTRKEWILSAGVSRWRMALVKQNVEFIQKCRALERSKGRRVVRGCRNSSTSSKPTYAAPARSHAA